MQGYVIFTRFLPGFYQACKSDSYVQVDVMETFEISLFIVEDGMPG
jgi:hypothetical protein